MAFAAVAMEATLFANMQDIYMTFFKAFAVASALTLGTVSAADAATVLYTSNVQATQTTNYATSLGLQKFNPALGTLQSVKVTLFGNLSGSLRFESFDASPSTIVTNLSASLTLTRPDNSTLIVTIPAFSQTFNVAAFDGTFDWGGTSGFTSAAINASSSNAVVLTGATDLALFTGLGSLNSPLRAQGTSSATGSGNLVTQFTTKAGGYATVEYTFAAVPEPASWALMLGGFGLIGVALRRRSAEKLAFNA